MVPWRWVALMVSYQERKTDDICLSANHGDGCSVRVGRCLPFVVLVVTVLFRLSLGLDGSGEVTSTWMEFALCSCDIESASPLVVATLAPVGGRRSAK